MAGQENIAELERSLQSIEALYITDGHHRAAAGAALARKIACGSSRSYRPRVLQLRDGSDLPLPTTQTRRIQQMRQRSCRLDRRRVCAEGQRTTRCRTAPHDRSRIEARPTKPGSFGMYVGGKWYRLTVPDELRARDDAYGGLDVVLLNNLVLGTDSRHKRPSYQRTPRIRARHGSCRIHRQL